MLHSFVLSYYYSYYYAPYNPYMKGVKALGKPNFTKRTFINNYHIFSNTTHFQIRQLHCFGNSEWREKDILQSQGWKLTTFSLRQLTGCYRQKLALTLPQLQLLAAQLEALQIQQWLKGLKMACAPAECWLERRERSKTPDSHYNILMLLFSH